MIQPIGGCNTAFKGQIKSSKYLSMALAQFSEKELAEFNTLHAKAMKVNDGKVYHVLKGCKCKTENLDNFTKTEYNHYIGLYDENSKPLSKEIYEIEVGSWKYSRVVSTDKNAFVRAILDPLRKLYNN